MADTIAVLITTERKSRRQSQTEAGACFGASQGAVSAWERGDTVPQARFRTPIARWLGLPLQTVIDACVAGATEIRREAGPIQEVGLTGAWYIGPSGAARADTGIVPGSFVKLSAEDVWHKVCDTLAVEAKRPRPFPTKWRWRSHRKVHSGPYKLHPWSVLTDADGATYRAPEWLVSMVKDATDPKVVVLPAEDQPSGLAVAVVRDSQGVLGLCALTQLS